MIEITIEGLNARQRVLADIIWACDTRQQIVVDLDVVRTQLKVIYHTLSKSLGIGQHNVG